MTFGARLLSGNSPNESLWLSDRSFTPIYLGALHENCTMAFFQHPWRSLTLLRPSHLKCHFCIDWSSCWYGKGLSWTCHDGGTPRYRLLNSYELGNLAQWLASAGKAAFFWPNLQWMWLSVRHYVGPWLLYSSAFGWMRQSRQCHHHCRESFSGVL